MQNSLSSDTLPVLTVADDWRSLLLPAGQTALETVLPGYLAARRWFGSKARTIEAVHLLEVIPLGADAVLTLVQVSFTSGPAEIYVLPLAFAAGEAGDTLRHTRPNASIAELHSAKASGVLYDAIWDKPFATLLLEAISSGGEFVGRTGKLTASPTIAYPWLRGDPREPLTPHVLRVEQSNTNVRYGERMILKLFRRLEAGLNPDQEIGTFLTERVAFGHVPAVAGALTYYPAAGEQAGEAISLALLQGFVANQGDAWRYTLESLQSYFAQALNTYSPPATVQALPQEPLLRLAQGQIPAEAEQFIGAYLDSARLLGQRTAELHLALASAPDDPVFGLEPFNAAYRSQLRQAMQQSSETVFALLRSHLHDLPAATQPAATRALDLQDQIVANFDTLMRREVELHRTRIHGDYHLGQVLYTGSDFMIIDFEGEPARPLPERRKKGSPLQDVAGMLRSFHYAAYAAYFYAIDRPDQSAVTQLDLETWTRYWHVWVSVAYLQSYLQAAQGAPFLPADDDTLRALLDAYLLSKAVYELGYELNNRPHWVAIPLQGILQTAQAA
ncbi:MAG: putative maltokinase [Caldilineales bacterium]